MARIGLLMAGLFALGTTCSPSVSVPIYGAADPALVGTWRIFSEAIFYDAGGNNVIDPVTTDINLNADGSWDFGSSYGAWSVADIGEADWAGWGVDPYGPTRMIVLDGWDGGVATGPIEESEFGIDGFWVIYRTDTGFGPATVQINFGASY